MIRLKHMTRLTNGSEVHYLSKEKSEPIDYEDLVSEMESESTVTRHDIKAVVSALDEWLVAYMLEGYSVRLGDLGTFRCSVQAEAQESEELVTAQTITAVKVKFDPSPRLREAVGKAELELGD